MWVQLHQINQSRMLQQPYCFEKGVSTSRRRSKVVLRNTGITQSRITPVWAEQDNITTFRISPVGWDLQCVKQWLINFDSLYFQMSGIGLATFKNMGELELKVQKIFFLFYLHDCGILRLATITCSFSRILTDMLTEVFLLVQFLI